MSTIEAVPVQDGERRRWVRAQVHLPVQLVDTESSFRVLSGQTVDICLGGVRAHVDGPMSGEVDATVRIDLAPGRALVCQALVAGGGAVDGGWEYRLAFRNLDPTDVAALEHLVDHAA